MSDEDSKRSIFIRLLIARFGRKEIEALWNQTKEEFNQRRTVS